MSAEAIWTVVAIVVGPIVAVLASLLIGGHIADRKQRRDLQFKILTTIVMMQWKVVSEDHVKALNLIDLIFHDAPEVRKRWSQYFDALCRRDLPPDEASSLWRKKQLELIHEMACHLGFKKTMQQLDFDRIYSPVGLSQPSIDDPEVIDKLMALLTKRKEELTSDG
jgi:hypothetical protein